MSMHNDQENGKNIMTSNEIIDRVKELKYVNYLIYMQKLFLYLPTMHYYCIYWSRCTNEHDVTCLLATQFMINEGADKTPTETYFD